MPLAGGYGSIERREHVHGRNRLGFFPHWCAGVMGFCLVVDGNVGDGGERFEQGLTDAILDFCSFLGREGFADNDVKVDVEVVRGAMAADRVGVENARHLSRSLLDVGGVQALAFSERQNAVIEDCPGASDEHHDNERGEQRVNPPGVAGQGE